MKRKIFYIVCLLLLNFNLFSQAYDFEKTIPELKRNAVFGTIGIGLVYGTIMGNYERLLYQRPTQSFGARVAAGSYGNFEKAKGVAYLVSVFGLTGSWNNHFEFGLGINIRPQQSITANIYPSANVGYRFQKPGGILIFRIGAGWPDAIYMSLGVCF